MAEMIRAGSDLKVDPDFVASLKTETSHYANCSGPTVLIIRMADGIEHRIEHTPGYLDGTDVYAVEREIMAAKARKR